MSEQPFANASRAASVAFLRAMDREPRPYLIELLRAYHAGAEREELGELLREAFREATAANIAPGKWTLLRDRFAGWLSIGPERDREMPRGELFEVYAMFGSTDDARAAVPVVALFAHAMSVLCDES